MPAAYEERILFHIFASQKYFIIRKDYFISHSDISLYSMLRIDLFSLLCYNTPNVFISLWITFGGIVVFGFYDNWKNGGLVI